MTAGYYRFPTLHDTTVVFVSEDDLWRVPTTGGVARRLTSNLGDVSYPMLSPDGEQVAFVGREEGAPEVYVMAADGGQARRLTYLSSNCRVLGWSPDGRSILFASNYGQPVRAEMGLFSVAADGQNGEVTPLPYGAARSIAYGPNGGIVIGRNTGDPARWKRYRGGTAGYLWIDRNGDGEFERLLPDVTGNIASPMWLPAAATANGDQDRVFFVSDHEGVGNLYSCRPDGGDLRRHTDHDDYYVRNPSSDGKSIVYHAGADLYLYTPATDTSTRIDVVYHSPRVQRNRRFVAASRYMDGFALHPTGKAIALTTRGKAYTFFNHEGPVLQYGKRNGVRYRCPAWLYDGRRAVFVSDEPGEETLEIYYGRPTTPPRRLEGLDIGRVETLKPSPVEDKIALTNHRYELLLIDLKSEEVTVVDRSLYRNIAGFDWSPDGRWLAYSFAPDSRTNEIRLYQLPEEAEEVEETAETEAAASEPGTDEEDTRPVKSDLHTEAGDVEAGVTVGGDRSAPPIARTGTRHVITRPVLQDVQPAFDPEGKYLYFLSYREFNPVYDGLHFDLGFPWGMRPYLVTLRADLPNPFVPVPDLEDEDEGHDHDHDDDDEHDDEDHDDEDHDEDHDGEEDEDGDFDGDDDEDDDVDEGDVTLRRFAAAITQAQDGEPRNDKRSDKQRGGNNGEEKRNDQRNNNQRNKERKRIRIDLDGIAQRVVAFPVPDGRYGQIAGIPGKALFTLFPIHGQLDDQYDWDEEPPESGELRAYDFRDYRADTLADNVSSFKLSANRKRLIYTSRGQLRVIAAGEKAPSSSGSPRKTGWIDLHRVKVSVDPQREWEQMFREAWRLQRDHFWTEDMSQVDWLGVYERYFQLIERVSTRGEFSDLMWEMQGELGTSHAYEMGGDYRPRPYYGQGFLGAELRYDAAAGGYVVGDLVVGDPWDIDTNSPLVAPGVDVRPGDVLVAINGQPLDETTGPSQLLVNQARNEVLLTYRRPSQETENGAGTSGAAQNDAHASDSDGAQEAAQPSGARQEQPEKGQSASTGDAAPPGDEPDAEEADRDLHNVVIKAIADEAPARYRQWVNRNRQAVHEATDGKVGYVHIPDMGAGGYAEFHRGYLAEVDRDALIVDVRYNGGGHVSQLILEKLARRRLGYDLSRWGGLIPYPVESVAGPLVALTNEHAGSDGDIFCHSFKLMKLGPLIGKRTWGGVIGISPRHALVDGTITTQPEYSFWFEDVGWGVENYGTDPDIDVDITPQDYRMGRDPQLERAIAEALRLLEQTPRPLPELTSKPSRALPKLPPRPQNGP